MATTFGPTFGDEIRNAGLMGLPFSWGADGSISGRENLTTEQNATLDGVIAAHDPALTEVPDLISRRQCYQAWAQQGVITEAEALDAVSSGKIPASFEAGIVAAPADKQLGLRMALAGNATFSRRTQTTKDFGVAMNWTPRQIDDTWRLATTLVG